MKRWMQGHEQMRKGKFLDFRQENKFDIIDSGTTSKYLGFQLVIN